MTYSTLSRKRVAVLVPRWPPDAGGVARAAHRLTRGLIHQRPVRVIIPQTSLPVGQLAISREEEIEVWRFGANTWRERQVGFEACLRKKLDFGLIHAIYPSETGRPAIRVAREGNLPCLLAARGNDLDRDAHRPDRGPALGEALAGADAVVGVSQALTETARRLGAHGRLLTIPNGVSHHRFRVFPRDANLARQLGIEPAQSSPVIAFVGEARPKKGLDTMLEAFAQLLTTHPQATLWLMGGLRADGEGIWQNFKHAHPQAAVRVRIDRGFHPDDLSPLLALADLAWLPSTQDGLPNGLLEALASGLPTIASTVGGIPDVLAHGPLQKLLIPPSQPQALVETTRNLLADAPLCAELAALGRKRVLEAFSPTSEIRAYQELYADLLNENTPTAS